MTLVAAGAGLFWQDEGSTFTFTTLHGQQVQIYGQGLYRYDTPITALGFKMADAVTLTLATPLLVIALLLYGRGSLRGGILLAGVLAYFLYNYSSLALGSAYNNLFLVYVAVMALSLFAFVMVLGAFDAPALVTHFSPTLPRRGIGIYLTVSGVILLLIWLVLSIIPALLQGQTPPAWQDSGPRCWTSGHRNFSHKRWKRPFTVHGEARPRTVPLTAAPRRR